MTAAPAEDRRDFRFAGLAAAAALLLAGLAAWLDPTLYNDVAMRYLPMIREFAAGNWERAFHPRIQPLFVVVGGCCAWVLPSPLLAAKAASVGFYAVAALPLYALQRGLFGNRAARWAVVLYLLCPLMIRYGISGLRDPARTFFVVLLAAGLVGFVQRPGWRAALGVGLGAAGMTLVRGDAALYALAGLAALSVAAAWPGPQRGRRLAWAAGAWGLFALLILPWLLYCWRETGYPVTASQQAPLLAQLERRTGWPISRPPRLVSAEPTLPLATAAASEAPAGAVAPPPAPAARWRLWLALGLEALGGLFPPALLVVLAVLAWRWRRRRLEPAEVLLLGAWLAYGLLLALQLVGTGGGSADKRYLAAVFPLTCGWLALGTIAAWDWSRARGAGWRLAGPALAAVAVAACLYVGLSSLRSEARPRKRAGTLAERACADWLRTQGAAAVAQPVPLPSSTYVYHNGRSPLVLGGEAAIKAAALAGADVLPLAADDLAPGQSYRLAELLAFCRAHHVQFLLRDDELVRLCPELAAPAELPAELRSCYRTAPPAQPMTWLGFRPELKSEAIPAPPTGP